MIEFVRCHPQHLWLFEPQAVQISDARAMQAPSVAGIISTTVAISGFVGTKCVGCAGIIDVTPDTALVWALLSKDAGRFMLPITRKVRRVMAAYPAPRFAASVARGFGPGARWMEALGFRVDDAPGPWAEPTREYYEKRGEDVDMYVYEKQGDASW